MGAFKNTDKTTTTTTNAPAIKQRKPGIIFKRVKFHTNFFNIQTYYSY